MEFLGKIGNGIVAVSDFICGYPFFILLIGGGLYFLVYSGFISIRHYGSAIRVLRRKDVGSNGQISSAQALMSAVAATVGVGNIAGVAIAISMGGPGAIFWMWVSALLGMSTKFFEGSLSVMYKGKDSNGEIQGGMMYVIMAGLKRRWHWLAYMFSIAALFGSLCIMQSNQITEAVTTVFFPGNAAFVIKLVIGLVICAIVSVVVLGGIERIANVASKMVPIMVGCYFILVLCIILSHISAVPGVFADIFRYAFNVKAGAGGVAGSLISVAFVGVRRAALVNEAGIGTSSMMHGASKNTDPVKEGLTAMLEPSIDSGLVCTLTAIAILIQKDVIPMGGMSSVEGMKVALTAFDASIPGIGKYLLLIIILTFGFSTMFSYSYYGIKSAGFLFGAKNAKKYNYFYLAVLVLAAIIPLKTAVSIVDLSFATMALPTVVTMIMLSPRVKPLIKAYFSNNKQNKNENRRIPG
ncbi:MAG: alanine:cation symporter family protein [Bacteroidales bacterium]|jgi:AGCS family alanine or glycine:cation symporter|nr:alanine:cation symporter family protein [Bacteroidales bacterium]MCI2121207.1 alanine:cation symporter family protein [Bacteroidales bacterium]MCI2146003.1 alanine:cation symporter family protein [Bacteroidales bacterium]